MEQSIIIGLDLAKNVFQAHGAKADGNVAFRVRLGRSRVLLFFAKQPACLVAMEACASAQANGIAITAGFEFDVPVRLDTDVLDVTHDVERLGSITSIPLIEVRR